MARWIMAILLGKPIVLGLLLLLLLLLLLRPEALSLKGSSSMLHNYDLLILLSISETFPILPFLLLFLFYITFIFEVS